jgi:hypothetical protein
LNSPRFLPALIEFSGNPSVMGNGGGIDADGKALQGFATSASIIIPANGVWFSSRRRRP